VGGGQPGCAFEVRDCGEREVGRCLADYVDVLARAGSEVTVIVPGPARLNWTQRLWVGRSWRGIVEHLRDIDNARVVVVRHHDARSSRPPSGDSAIASRHRVLILAGRLDRSVVKAVRYARSIEALSVSALHAAVDPVEAEKLQEQWLDFGEILDIPLDLHECSDRNVARVVKLFIDRLKRDGSEVTVVLPRREYGSGFQRVLHDRTSRAIANLVRFEPGVDLVVVPYRLGRGFEDATPGATNGSTASASRPRSSCS
jgi:hypothetical protein